MPAPSAGPDTVTVVLLDTVETGRAPWALTAGERLVFKHLYETLIDIDCRGQVRAGVAVSWESGNGGRRWTFELRKGARFWDGTPVTAWDVASSWHDALTLSTEIDSIGIAGGRHIDVYLKRPRREVPRELSSSVYAIAKPSEETPWFLGSGAYRIDRMMGRGQGPSGRTILVRSATGAEGPVIRFVENPGGDARDWLEGDIDLMVASDPAVIGYASGRARLTTVPLPWDMTYVLLSTSRVAALEGGVRPGKIDGSLSDALARDAVRGDARGHRPPSWWDTHGDCDGVSDEVRTGGPSGTRRLLFDEDDPVARDLAERILALASRDPAISWEAAAIAAAIPGLSGEGPSRVADGVPDGELERSLRHGDDFAYIIGVPCRPADPCFEVSELVRRAPWLAPPDVELADALVPLVDTRRYAIAMRDRFGLTVDWYGTVSIVPAADR